MRTRPIDICFLIDELRTGGTETQLLSLIAGLDRTRFRPHLCLLDGERESSKQLEPSGCPVLRLGVRKIASFRALSAGRRLRRYLRRNDIDILQMFFQDSTYFGSVVGAFGGVRCLIRTRRDLVFWDDAFRHQLIRQLNGVAHRFLVDAVIANSDACRQAVIRDDRVTRNKIHVIANGLPLSRFVALPCWSRGRNGNHARHIGVVAMLRPEKGLDVFLRSLGRLRARRRDFTVTLAGEGELRHDLERQAEALGLVDCVRFAGRVDDVPAFLDTVDVAVLPSHTEGSPNAVIEYMAAGRPLVATAVGGTTELIADGVNGLLVPPNDEIALADRLDELLDDPTRAERLARAARDVGRDFSLHNMIRRHENLYRQLMFATEQAATGTQPGDWSVEEANRRGDVTVGSRRGQWNVVDAANSWNETKRVS